LGGADHTLVEDVADAHLAGPVIDPENAPFTLVTGRDETVLTRRLGTRAFARAVAEGDPDRAFL